MSNLTDEQIDRLWQDSKEVTSWNDHDGIPHISTTYPYHKFARAILAQANKQMSDALYGHLMGGAFDIGEAYLNLKVVGSCPSEADFLAALLALAAKEPS